MIRNQATSEQIRAHLEHCDSSFIPPLSQTVNLNEYARKIHTYAERFESWKDGKLTALVAAYLNAKERGEAYITNVSVLPEHRGQGLAKALMLECVAEARRLNFGSVALQVAVSNREAVKLYDNLGFLVDPNRPRHRVLSLK